MRRLFSILIYIYFSKKGEKRGEKEKKGIIYFLLSSLNDLLLLTSRRIFYVILRFEEKEKNVKRQIYTHTYIYINRSLSSNIGTGVNEDWIIIFETDPAEIVSIHDTPITRLNLLRVIE